MHIHKHSIPRQSNRIRLHIPANACAAIPVPVLVQVRFRIKILLRQLQVDLCCRGRVNSGFAESLVVRFPRRLARLVQRQYGHSQMVRDQVVVAGFFQAGFAVQLRLPDRVGAP